MRITFLMPCYVWAPSGGFRVVYEYANKLANRGHQVAVVHPRRLKYPPPVDAANTYRWVRGKAKGLLDYVSKPSIDWQPIDRRVRLLFVPSSDPRHIPDGDAVFATAWHTARSVLECPPAKGEKFYLIQHYETWMGPKDLVDATWRFPLHKVVIAKWLLELGKGLGCRDLAHIPNAIDHDRYKLKQPIERRARQVAMMFSTAEFKGSADGIEAIRIARERYPDLRIVFFGTSRSQPWIPEWVTYYRNPPQDFIINEIYNKSCIFLSPSLSEGWSLPPTEAAACGCAIVSTDHGGIREYAQSGVTALLSRPGDPMALAANLCLLLGNEDLRVRLAKAANSFIARLNWGRSAALLEDFITRWVTQRAGMSGQSLLEQENLILPTTPMKAQHPKAGTLR